MKKTIKGFGIIVLLMLIGISLTGCGDLSGNDKTDKKGNISNTDKNDNNNDSNTSTNRTITIKNNTGYSLGSSLYIKLSTSSDWGSSVGIWLNNGESKAFTLPARISNNGIYDLRYYSSSGYYTKYYITINNGMTLTFTSSDYDDGSKNPKITIKNLSGVSFGCYVKPSSASDWGVMLESVSNNSSKTITLPFLLTNFSVFDIQMRSSSPNNTYTKNNVTVSNGMTVTYTPNDSDNPNIISPVIIIQNNTGYSLGSSLYIKLSTSSDWGSSVGIWLDNGESKAFTLPARISNNGIYDLRYYSSSGYFTKKNVSLSYGMTVTFTYSDKE